MLYYDYHNLQIKIKISNKISKNEEFEKLRK